MSQKPSFDTQTIENISLKSLQLFLKVFHSRSFSEVARQENTAPSQISRVISQLEEALQQQLFIRNTRAMVPTEAGVQFMQTARRICDEMNAVQDLWLSQSHRPSGLIRLNAPVMFARKHIVPYLTELMERYPKLQIELLQTDEFIDPHTNGADIIFRLSELPDLSMRAKIFARQQYYLAASPQYLQRYGRPGTPADLSRHYTLPYKGSFGLQRWRVKIGGDWVRQLIEPRLISNNAETLLQLAIQGAGIVLFPDWLLHEHLCTGELLEVLSDYEFRIYNSDIFLAALYPNNRFTSLNIRAVLDFFSEKFGEIPYWVKNSVF